MQTSRKEGADALIHEAARKLRQWNVRTAEWMNDANAKRHLAEDLCTFIARKRLQSYHQEVRPNWVTRNRQAIERKRSSL
jgi:hypothetical protein